MLQIVKIGQTPVSADMFGGKANGLYLLEKNGYLIPESFAIQATADTHDIEDSKFQEDLREKLAPYAVDGRYDLAVRSSCTLEDNYLSSMAGHYSSYLGVMSFDEVLENIKKIIADVEGETAEHGKMGIVIQQRVNADYSGVLFSSDPISYSKKQIIVTYTCGTGEELVSGKIAGTDVVISIENEQYIIDSTIESQLQERLISLVKRSKRLEALLKYPLDIEWAIKGSKVYFLQCRPLTSITSIPSTVCAVKKENLTHLPAQLVSHDKIKLRLMAQKSGIFISDAYVYIRNSCSRGQVALDIPRSNYYKGYSAVIIYPKRLSNKVIRSFVGDKMNVIGSITDCCRYGIRSFPEYENLSSCLSAYSEKIDNDYWLSTTIIQEIFDPLYTGVVQRIPEGFLIEITRGHFLTKGVVPTSQYITSKSGNVLERTEIRQQNWLKIIEGHVVYCVCNNDEEDLVSVDDSDIRRIIECFTPVLQLESNVVEFGLLRQEDRTLVPYLIDFVDDNSPINLSAADIKSGIVSYGCITGKPVVINELDVDSLNEHYHNASSNTLKSQDKVIFICKNPELALLQLIDQYEPQNIGFVFQNCAVGAHIAVVLREKRIPAIKTGSLLFGLSHLDTCTIDAKTPGLQPKERLIYE